MAVGNAALLGFDNLPVVPPHAENVGKNFDKKLYNACQDFEAIFVNQMLDSMRATLNKHGLLDGGIGENIYQDMLYQQYSQMMAKTAHFGLARLLYNQLAAGPS